MKTLDELKATAEESAKFRGHETIKWVTPWHGERASIQGGYCPVCGMMVQLITNPLPNQIDVGGEAVALGCKGKERV